MSSTIEGTTASVLEKWQNYTKRCLDKSNTNSEEQFNLAILELEVPYGGLGFESFGQFLLQVPNIGEVLLDQSNIFQKPSIKPIGYSPILNFGDKVAWFGTDIKGKEVIGVIHWLGLIQDTLCAGLVCDQRICPAEELTWLGTKLFESPSGCGKILRVTELILHKDFESKLQPPTESSSIIGSIKKSIIKSTVASFAGASEKYNPKGVNTVDLISQSVKFNKDRSSFSDAGTDNEVKIYPRSVESVKPDGLKVNDVVVSVTDNGTFNGIVMWLGQLRSSTRQIHAGVDFQQNIGDTNGKFGEHTLFQCKPNQGKFIPIEYLVKYDDFYESPKQVEQEPESSSGILNKDNENGRSNSNEGPNHLVAKFDLTDLDQNQNMNNPDIEWEILPCVPTKIQEYQIGDCVTYSLKSDHKLNGVIKWIGKINGKYLAGIDFEEKTGLSEGNEDIFPFEFKPGHGGLAPLAQLEHYRPKQVDDFQNNKIIDFNTARPPEEFYAPKNSDLDNPEFLNTFIEPYINLKYFGRSIGFHQGIQGKNNSCYIDATLFLMLAYNNAFDKVLLQDDPYANVWVRNLKTILRTDIANQLRRNYFLSWANVNILKKAMSGLSSRIRNSEMADIEEFLYTLFEQALKLNPFIHYSSGVSDFVHQILPNSKDVNQVITTQKILENSMFAQHNLKFTTPPTPGLFLAMPRSSGKLVQYDSIVPSLKIDITHLLHNIARPCTICSTQIATLECLECFDMIGNTGMSSTAFCEYCFNTFHNGESRQPHKTHVKNICHSDSNETQTVASSKFEHIEFDLVGVICIRDNHYVSFVKCGTQLLAPWVMHNSMAEEGIPEIRDVPGLGECLLGLEKDPSYISKDWQLYLPEIQRILRDLYFCVYSLRECAG